MRTDRASGAEDREASIGAIVVASWYPSVLDPIFGRFVADQVRGIAETGRVQPRIVSFDPVNLTGGPDERREQLRALRASTERTAGHAQLFRPRGWSSPPGVPVARPSIATGWVADAEEPSRQLEDRGHALLAVAERLADGLPRTSLVHAHVAYPDGAAAALLADRLGLPLVVTEHATFVPRILADPTQRAGYLDAVRAAARFVAVSETFADELRRDIPELAEKLRVIPNVVATDDFELVDPSVRHADELLFVGYRKDTKGIDLLLDAFALVLAARPSARLRLVGRSPSRTVERRWQEQAKALGITHAVRFDGPANRAGVVAAMRDAALLVHAGYRETFGVVAVEALATGLPVIATDSGGITEILGDDAARLGALVRSREPGALSAAILDALAHRDRFDPASLRTSVEDRFGVRAVSERVVDLYEEVLAEHQPTAQHSRARPGATRRAIPAAGRARVVVVGLDAARAASTFAQLPAALLGRITLVTLPHARARLPDALGAVLRIDPDVEYREAVAAAGGAGPRGGAAERIARLAGDPLGPLRRRRVRSRRDEIMRDAPLRTMRRAAHAVAGPGRAAHVIPLEAGDFVVVRALVEEGVLRLAPGGIRWLADGHADESG